MLTESVAAPVIHAPPAEPPRRADRGFLRLLPGVLVLIVVAGVLRHHDVGLLTQARFAAHVTGVVLVPGVLVWRLLRRAPGTLPSDLAGGVAIGYAMEIGWYLAGRAAGFPYLHVVAAGAVVVAFAAVPRLRRHWRSGQRADVRWSWAVAGLCVATVAWSAATFLPAHPLDWPGYSTPYQDMVFHQALAGELRHHLPAQMPTVAGLPLSYHWFVHADWAAATWSTGIESRLMVYRLGLMPAVVLLAVAVACVAQRIAPARWWTGPLAAALAVFAVAPDPAAWSTTAAPAASMLPALWLSPTQTFGCLLFAGAVLVLADLLGPDRTPGRNAGRWLLFTLAVAGATGAKATYAPLLGCGLAAVVVAGLLRRVVDMRAVVAGVITTAAFAVAAVTVFPGTTGGLELAPLASFRGWPPGWTPWHVSVVWALGWTAVIAAAAMLLLRRGERVDPMPALCAGICAAAVAVVLVTTQPGGGQMYFLVSARPYAAVLVVTALAAVVPPLRAGGSRRLVPAAVAGGVAVTVLGESLSPAQVPVTGAAVAIWPYALPVGAAVLSGALLAAFRRTRPVALLAGGAVLIGAVVPTAVSYGRAALAADQARVSPPMVPRGAPSAGRWLRAHTGTDDLLASNNHCWVPGRWCEPRQFWLAAYAERRVLVEGWSYTAPANAMITRTGRALPFWDAERLAANDAAFRRPGPDTLDRLRGRYGVDWMVVDTRWPYDRAGLDRSALLRYRTGQVAIYQLGAGDR